MNLETVAAKAADDLKLFIDRKRDEILAAIEGAIECSEENETACKFKLGLSITLDLDKSQQENILSWGVRHKISAVSQIEDPAQLRMEAVTGQN